ncbi:hypothetical protein A4G26_01800 [Mycobacterium kansasii]|nr:hypothetical protein A4G26_01800 [Mycobacterium kansasii]
MANQAVPTIRRFHTGPPTDPVRIVEPDHDEQRAPGSRSAATVRAGAPGSAEMPYRRPAHTGTTPIGRRTRGYDDE